MTQQHDRIKADAENKALPYSLKGSWVNYPHPHVGKIFHPGTGQSEAYSQFLDGYIAGAAAEHERAQGQIRNLLDTLEKIVHAPVPANEREYISWFVTAKNIAGGTISAYEAEVEVQQWKGKEGGDEM